MVFSYYSAWDSCVDLARTSEEERARLWDLCCASEADKEVIHREVCYSKSSACIVIKVGNADYSFLCYVLFFLELNSQCGVVL